MSTIAIAQLKAHLSAEIKRVRAGETLIILDHKQPVAKIVPLVGEDLVYRKASSQLSVPNWPALIDHNVMDIIAAERADSW